VEVGGIVLLAVEAVLQEDIVLFAVMVVLLDVVVVVLVDIVLLAVGAVAGSRDYQTWSFPFLLP